MIFHSIGLMSGTSLDGLDICYSIFEKHEDDSWSFRILEAQTRVYPNEWEQKLKKAISFSSEDLLELNSEYGFFLGREVKEFIEKHDLKKIDVIASHGHTVFHQPERKFTLQIGDGRAIKIENDIPVVYDFRSQDVLLGGNGAPLVPIGDELLFSMYDGCINLGGFSNISMKINGKRMAFDICPVNTVLNNFALQLGKKYDKNGSFAKQGNVDLVLLEKLNSLAFYKQNPPKSLGIEWVNQNIYPILESLDAKDILATFTEHIAEKIAEVFQKYHLNTILFTGGGSYNTFLIERIKQKTKSEILIPSKEIIDYKEALIFGFMGILRLNQQNNVLCSATGSRYDHCSGILI